jgi:hypothetical protein
MDSLPLEAGDDSAFAAVSLVEGDATTAMVLWASENLSPEDILDISQTPLPDTTGVPAWMVTQLGFPYLEGTDFTSELYARGGFAAVDEAWADPPRTTEQILHIDSYIEDEEPVAVAPPAPDLPLGVELVQETTFGEAMFAIWLGALGVSQSDANVAAAGWGGDRMAAYHAIQGDELAVVISITWDAPLDATEFSEAYEEALGRTNLIGRVDAVSDTDLVVIQGTSQAVVDALAGD